jgi:hypothetical protein
MVSGNECVSRRPEGWEFTIRLEAHTGHGQLRLTMNEVEVRDWHMRLSRALASLDASENRPPSVVKVER